MLETLPSETALLTPISLEYKVTKVTWTRVFERFLSHVQPKQLTEECWNYIKEL